MSDRPRLTPDATHPITVEPTPGRVRVWLGEQLIADTTHAMTLREATYPPVQYIPRDDVVADVLTASAHSTYCPYKGDAGYHGLRGTDGSEAPDKAWFYAEPYRAVAEIADHLAFYPDAVRVEID
ncbi:DUF427 domain-containing protein [Gordonia sp. L191]|uniref:DUF427 domain-containing protein n=1 Tax=Gordonia sp. L191 TaxID=2982699 RepID=UPI0024BFCEC2|nr:DUF427 domain-containing protein [Gordonia sp. L191]WHU47344.1 DUF427 domain-containing protein [Gordonia sp. L191]